MADAAANACPICGTAMYAVHCKLICPNCGYREDCSDIFPVEPPPDQPHLPDDDRPAKDPHRE